MYAEMFFSLQLIKSTILMSSIHVSQIHQV